MRYTTLVIFIFISLVSLQPLISKSFNTVVVGYDQTFPPFEFKNNDGTPDGFNHALLKEICVRNSWNQKVRSDLWTNILTEFEAGKIDLLAGLVITDKRAERYVFSTPHSYIHYSVFLRRGQQEIESWKDLEGKTVIVQSGDVVNDLIDLNVKSVKKQFVPDFHIALNMLAEGYGDLAIMPRILGYAFIVENDLNNLVISTTLDFAYPYSVAALPHNKHLIDMVNTTLAQMQEDGTIQKLSKKWYYDKEDLSNLKYSQTKRIIYILMFFVIISLAILVVFVIYYKKLLRLQTEKLLQQIKEKQLITDELKTIHRLYQIGPIVVMKWYDSDKELFKFITENISGFGYNASDILNGNIHYRDIIHPEDYNHIRQENQKIVQDGIKSYQQSYRILCPSNETTPNNSPSYLMLKQRNPILAAANSYQVRWVLDHTVQVYDKDKDIQHYYGYLMDLTELYNHFTELNSNRKLAESAEKSKDIFLSSISDEISIPIHNLFETITQISNSGINEEQQDSLIKLHASAFRLKNVIEQIQTFLYYAHTASETDLSWIELQLFIDEELPFYKAKAEVKNIMLEHTNPSEWIKIQYSKRYLKDIFNIILENAIKFSSQGLVHVLVGFIPETDEDGRISVCVTDEGIGIPPDKIDYILKPFTQIDDSYTREYGGLGLGLAILSQIVNISEGSLTIANRVPRGVEVCVEWSVKYMKINPVDDNQ